MKKNILLVGFGKLGKLIANELLNSKHKLTVVKRTEHAPQDNIHFITHDIRTNSFPAALNHHFDDVIICVTPNDRNKVAYQDIYLDGVLPFIKQIKSDHIWLVSSSAVYPQNDGTVVNENTKCEPKNFNGNILLKCEQALAHFTDQHSCGFTTLRLAGIYGSSRRHLINQIENEHYPDQLHYTNRIHEQDAAKAICALVDKQAKEPIINICDNYSATMFEVADFIRAQLCITNKKPWPKPLEQNKRIDNALLKKYYVNFKYPTYKEGLIESLENE